MPAVALVFAGVAAAVHVVFFVLESVLFRRPLARRLFGVRGEEVEVLAIPMLNQGFYNLFLAIGTAVGIVGVARDWEPQGSVLVWFCCLSMIAASIVLVISRPALIRGALIQGVPPLLALGTAALW